MLASHGSESIMKSTIGKDSESIKVNYIGAKDCKNSTRLSSQTPPSMSQIRARFFNKEKSEETFV